MPVPSWARASAARPNSSARPRRAPDPPMAILANLALLFAAIFVVRCVLLAAFVGSLLYMVVLHRRLKEKGLGRERGLLATPLPPDAELPHVVVQISSFNEGPVLRRGVEAAARLDRPGHNPPT